MIRKVEGNYMRNILLIAFCIIIVSCKKDPITTKLPDLTNIGANTFGCMINDEVYIPEHKVLTSYFGPITIDFPIYPNCFFSVNTNRIADNSDPLNNTKLYFNAEQVKKIGEYKIRGYVIDKDISYINFGDIPNGMVTITYIDTVKKIISGRFYFDAKEENGTQTIKITDGRFDLKND